MAKDIIQAGGSEEALEIAKLKQENEQLADQLKRLTKVETRLYEYQQELDAQLKEYQKLYEVNRKFSRNRNIQEIFEDALDFIINDLEYERAIFLNKVEGSTAYTVCAIGGYYDNEQKSHAAEQVINAEDPFVAPILQEGREYLICKDPSQDQCLVEYRSRFLMDEFLIYPIGTLAATPALLVIGGTIENAGFYRRISDSKGELLGAGNLVGLLSSTIENQISYSNMVKALNQERIAEAKYRSIFENAVEGIFQTSPDGRIIEANPSLAAILGYENQATLNGAVSNIGKDLYVDPSRRDELLRQLSMHDAVSDFEVQLRRKGGGAIWALLNARAVKDGGNTICLEGFLTDVSKRKKAEKALGETKQFLDKIINSITDPIFVKNQKHRWVLINDAFCAFMKRERKELLGKTGYDFYSKIDADICREKDRIVLESGKEDINEEEFTDASGAVHSILSKKALYTNEKGKKFIVGIITDITNIKQANEALRKSEQMLTNVLANFPGVVFWKDRNSVYIGCNKNFSNGAGLADPSEIVAKTDYDLPWGQTEADAYRADDRQVMESMMPKLNIIETQLQSDGSVVWFDTGKVPLFDQAGVVIGVLGISKNITKRKKAEDRLHKDKIRADMLLELYEKSSFLSEKQLYNYALNQVVSLTDSTIGFFHLISDDQKNVILTTWNDEALKNCTAAYDTIYSIDEAGNWVDSIRYNQPVIYNDYESSPNRKGLPDGHAPVRRFMSIPVMEGDKVRFIFGVGNKVEEYDEYDLTHIQIIANELQHIINQRHAEDMLRAAQEELVRKEKLAILGQLSGSVSHELRNPLGVMNNAIYLLKMILADADETTRGYLDVIKEEIDNSVRIITDLLDFARNKPPQIEAVKAGQLIDGSLNKCVIPENVTIKTDISESLPLLRIDPQQIEQVLQNLITNGIQAMPEGGLLFVAARIVTDDDFVEIAVSDSGEGITPENMKNLFQPLFTTKISGIGLGLVVCQNLVKLNGGKIEVTSKLGKGTTFRLKLPVEREHAS